jgi:hypothetical protein
VSAFVLVFLPQAYLYGGDPPNIVGRYLAPAIFFAILVAGLGYWLVEQELNSRIWLAASLVVALISGVLMVPQLGTANQVATTFSADTRSFQAGVHRVEDLLRDYPSAWVVLRPSQLLSYEADFAVGDFLENGPVPPEHIGIEAPPLPASPTALQLQLNATLEAVSAEGGRGFQALPAGLSASDCIEVDFVQVRSDTRCAQVVVITGV